MQTENKIACKNMCKAKMAKNQSPRLHKLAQEKEQATSERTERQKQEALSDGQNPAIQTE